jgi:hypothetical protein
VDGQREALAVSRACLEMCPHVARQLLGAWQLRRSAWRQPWQCQGGAQLGRRNLKLGLEVALADVQQHHGSAHVVGLRRQRTPAEQRRQRGQQPTGPKHQSVPA